MKDKTIIVASPIVYKRASGPRKWFIVKQKAEDNWELPKAYARTGESSVRAAIRTMGEQGGMKAKVLEEAGRAGGATLSNGKTLPVRYLYYLMSAKDTSGEAIGFAETGWFEYASAVRKLASKRDKDMLKKAREVLSELEQNGKVKTASK